MSQPAPGAAAPESSPLPAQRPARIASIDAYRGLVMFLMLAEALHLWRVATAYPGNRFWAILGGQQTHVDWVGCTLHDLIQPSFSFLVGVALPFSIASRVARGQSRSVMLGHALWRSLLLVLLGVFLRSVHSDQTNWTFEDTLSQIGLGYAFLFLLGFKSLRTQLIAFAVILCGYWLAWALYPLPGASFDYAAAGASADYLHNAEGFAAHWNKHINLGAAFDRWFLNLFPRAETYIVNDGGYLTLSFIPTLCTMLLGLVAGGWLKNLNLSPAARIRRFAFAGVTCLAGGLILHLLGLCPIVKRIWTPSWTLFSGGWCFLLLAAFYLVIDCRGWKTWSYPLVVIGMNSIAAYCMAHLIGHFITGSLMIHFGEGVFKLLGEPLTPILEGGAALVGFWLILYWMYRRKIFLRI